MITLDIMPKYGLNPGNISYASLEDVKEGSVIMVIARYRLKGKKYNFIPDYALLFENASSMYKHIAAEIMNEDIFTLDQLQEGDYQFRITYDGAFLGIYTDGNMNQDPEVYRAFIIKNGKPERLIITIEDLHKAAAELAPILKNCIYWDGGDIYVKVNDICKALTENKLSKVMGKMRSGYSFNLFELWEHDHSALAPGVRFGMSEVEKLAPSQNADESLETLANKFIDEMTKRGYSIFEREDKWMPSIIAEKPNHYRVEAIRFLDPNHPGFTVHATVGLDIHSIFYFQLQAPFDNLDKRFKTLMKEAEPFLDKDLGFSELRKSF